jgi:hypothetical protein
MTLRLAVVLGLISLMLAAGCQVSSSTTTGNTSPASNSTTLYYSVTPDSGPLIALCKADLAEITGITEADVELVSVTPFEFSDTSLGCPEPGKSYAQVITSGYIIILQAQGKQYEYHTDQHEEIVLCGLIVGTSYTTIDTRTSTGATPVSSYTASAPVPSTISTTTPKITDTTKETPPPVN